MGYEEARLESTNWRQGDQSEYVSGLGESDTLFSVRARPWHGEGVVLERSPATIAEALTLAGLDWEVEKTPVFVGTQTELGAVYTEIEGQFAIRRKDTTRVMGVVGGRYTIVQNQDAFAFVDGLIGSAMHFETAGSLYDGRKVWVLARLPEWIEVAGERIEEFVLFSNTHDGSGAVKVAITPIRTVCQNTLGWGIRKARAIHSIRHTVSVTSRLHEAKRVLELTTDYYKQFEQFGLQLASEKIAHDKVLGIWDDLYGGEATTDRALKNRDEMKAQLSELLTGSITAGGAPGTKWCAANSLCETIDYYRPTRGDTSNFGRMVFDAVPLKQKAVDLVVAA